MDEMRKVMMEQAELLRQQQKAAASKQCACAWKVNPTSDAHTLKFERAPRGASEVGQASCDGGDEVFRSPEDRGVRTPSPYRRRVLPHHRQRAQRQRVKTDESSRPTSSS